MKTATLSLIALLCSCPCLQAATSVSQYGVTWSFAGDHVDGVFANGDPWVVGPVTVVAITPAAEYDLVSGGTVDSICTGGSLGIASCSDWCQANAPADLDARCTGPERGYGLCLCERARNGCESNPADPQRQGFDNRIGYFDATLMVTLPYTAQPGESLVKVVSLTEVEPQLDRPKLETAVVLTVLATPPADGGLTVLRPPYFGADKPLISTASISTELLPALAPSAYAPTLAEVSSWFERVQLDHLYRGTGEGAHPTLNLPAYGADVARHLSEGALRLMLDDDLEDKMPALVRYLQAGIDYSSMFKHGATWPAGGGHGEGRKLPVAFTAALLDDQELGDAVAAAGRAAFAENDGILLSSVTGRLLFGQQELALNTSEAYYWNLLVTGDGFRSGPEPYGFIDGGDFAYQACCTAQPRKAEALAVHLMPALAAIWNNDDFLSYVDRWVYHGEWSQPDPCAPAETTMDNYGITFGPDPLAPGQCIHDADPSDGVGRFPLRHGLNIDGGGRASDFVRALWDEYRYDALAEVIVDNPEAVLAGSWSTSSASSGYYGADYLHDDNLDKGKSATYTPDLPSEGFYVLSLSWIGGSSWASNVPLTIVHAGGVTYRTVNEQERCLDFRIQGLYHFKQGTQGSVTISTAGTDGPVMADAVRFVLVSLPLFADDFETGDTSRWSATTE